MVSLQGAMVSLYDAMVSLHGDGEPLWPWWASMVACWASIMPWGCLHSARLSLYYFICSKLWGRIITTVRISTVRQRYIIIPLLQIPLQRSLFHLHQRWRQGIHTCTAIWDGGTEWFHIYKRLYELTPVLTDF
jgi:hypothetical protein